MTPRFCDHIYIVIKDLERNNPELDAKSIKDMKPGDVMILDDRIVGKLLVCHYCGMKKEVWEDGSIIDYKADGTRRT